MYWRRLTIKAPVTTDTGIYLCEASFQRPGGPRYPSVTATANLTIQGNFCKITKFNLCYTDGRMMKEM